MSCTTSSNSQLGPFSCVACSLRNAYRRSGVDVDSPLVLDADSESVSDSGSASPRAQWNVLSPRERRTTERLFGGIGGPRSGRGCGAVIVECSSLGEVDVAD